MSHALLNWRKNKGCVTEIENCWRFFYIFGGFSDCRARRALVLLPRPLRSNACAHSALSLFGLPLERARQVQVVLLHQDLPELPSFKVGPKTSFVGPNKVAITSTCGHIFQPIFKCSKRRVHGASPRKIETRSLAKVRSNSKTSRCWPTCHYELYTSSMRVQL